MDATTLNTVDIGLVNRSNFTIIQLKKSWESIIENFDEWVYFVCLAHGKPVPFTFHSVDLLRACDINEHLKDPDTSLIMLVEQEEVEE